MSAVWYIWVILAIVLFIAELITPGFLLGSFAVGCLGAALAAFLGLGLTGQLAAFCIGSLVVLFGIRPVLLKYFQATADKIKTNTDALIGKRGIVTEQIDSRLDIGRVKVAGEDWRATTDERDVIEQGEEVCVLRVDGTKLVVKPFTPMEEQ